MVDELNPFDQVFQGLWALIDASVPLQALVKTGNQIRYNKASDRDVFKSQIADADVPELALTTEGNGQMNLSATSSSSMIVKHYAWLLATGDMRVGYSLNPVTFALYSALLGWQDVLKVMTWKSKKFVTYANWLDHSEGLSDPERNRGLKGWSAIFRCEVRFDFATTDLKAFNLGT